jgi:hypothetical protein
MASVLVKGVERCVVARFVLGGGYSLLFAASLTFVLGIAGEGRGQVLLYGGTLPIVQTPKTVNLGPGVNNTKQVGAFPAVWNVLVACNTSEVESTQDLDGSGGLPADPLGGVVQILDLDAQVITNTTVQGSAQVVDQLSITEIVDLFGVATYVAWISREDQLFNAPNFGGVDLNGDGDAIDFVVMMMAYTNPNGPAVQGDVWALVPPASAGVSSGYRCVHISGELMVVEQGAPQAGAPVAVLPASIPPQPILVLDTRGFALPQVCPPLNPYYVPTVVNAGAGYNPKANWGFGFPQGSFLVYERRELDLAVDFNGDGDQCDHVVSFEQVTNVTTACPLGATCPPTCGAISLTLSGPCQMGVGNFPSTRPDATFGQYVGFDVLPAAQQLGFGPDCIPPSAQHRHRGRANPINSAPCSSGYSLGNNMFAESVSVAGPVFTHVVRETAPGVGDQNGDGFVDPGVVVWINQTTWPPTIRWMVMGPGTFPAPENVFNFVINPPSGGPFVGLTAYVGNEMFQSLGDLSGDGDQFDRVIQVHLR